MKPLPPLNATRSSLRILVTLFAVMWLAFALRVYQLGSVPFRGDEAFSVQYWSGIPLTQSLTTIATLEPHPPLAYAVFRAWGLFVGLESEFALRMLGVLVNLMGVPALYLIGRRTGGARYGVGVALLWAIHPFEIWHAQDYRNYALWAGLSALGLYWGIRTLQTRHKADLLRYAAIGLITSLIFYFELLSLAALAIVGMVALFRKHRAFLWQWLGAHIVVAVVTSLVFVLLQAPLFTSGSYGGNTQAFEPTLWASLFLPVLSVGDTLAPLPYDLPTLVLIATILSLCIWLTLRHNRKLGIQWLLLALLPIAFLSLIALRVSVFSPRYALSAVPAFVLLLGAPYLRSVTNRLSYLKYGLLVVYLLLVVQSLTHYYHHPAYRKSPDWFSVRDYFQQAVGTNDVIVQTSVDAALGYYLGGIASKALPYTPQQPASEIVGILEDLTAQHRALWLFEHTRQTWQNADIAPNWIRDHLQPVRETRLLGQPVQEFRTWHVSQDEISPSTLATFEGIAELVGYQAFFEPPTQSLTVVLYWRPIGTSQTPLKVFVHALGTWNTTTQTPLWAQDDRYPQNGIASTSTWEQGTLYRDVYHLPLLGVPKGTYTLAVGFYDPQTGERTLILGNETGAFSLAEFTRP
jgi:hypothetical protein